VREEEEDGVDVGERVHHIGRQQRQRHRSQSPVVGDVEGKLIPGEGCEGH
jgi:hypothetical protein